MQQHSINYLYVITECQMENLANASGHQVNTLQLCGTRNVFFFMNNVYQRRYKISKTDGLN